MWHVECKLTRKVNEKIYQAFFFKEQRFLFCFGFFKIIIIYLFILVGFFSVGLFFKKKNSCFNTCVMMLGILTTVMNEILGHFKREILLIL